MKHLPRLIPLAAALSAALSSPTFANESPTILMPRVDVIGTANRLPDLAGTGQIIDSKDLEGSRVFTVNEALRRVTGVNVRDEEGFGLRPNIGIRGLNPTRSTKVTLLEDGVPLAYAPYGDNASYYHPMVDRYERIEVLKGPGSLLFGPQTVGGTVNYITPAPPQEVGGYIQGAVGNRDYANAKFNIGGHGLLLDYTRKQGNGARDNLDHELDDLNVKYVMNLTRDQILTLRGNYYTENSTLTYTGLTQAEFDRFGARYNPFKNDRFDIKRHGFSATHAIAVTEKAVLTTNLYYSHFDRDWWRQSSNSTDTQCGTGFRDSRLAGIAVDPDSCNSIQGRLREYDTWGVEPRLTVEHQFGEFQAGVRMHYEEQRRVQINATSPTGRTGTVTENNLRETKAFSAYVSNRFDIGTFSITPIIRHEDIDAERRNRLTGDTGDTRVSKTTPGIGVTWNPSDALTVFAGAHKGFAPPRVEDLIGGTGTVTEVDPEESTNFELGARVRPTDKIALQAAYFRSDFDNLIAVGSIAGGNTPLSQGKALFEGVEFSGQASLAGGAFTRVAYTWLPVAEQSTSFRNVATQAVIAGSQSGLRQPYTPRNTLTAAAGYEKGSFRGELEAQYVGSQFSDFANVTNPTADGQRGEISSYTIWNASLNYRFDRAFSVFLTAKNLGDKTYIVDRTRGIQVGMPRLVFAGIRYTF